MWVRVTSPSGSVGTGGEVSKVGSAPADPHRDPGAPVILAAYRDTGYNIILLLHIVAVIAAFAPTVVNPLLERHLARDGGAGTLQAWAAFAPDSTRKTAMGSLGLARPEERRGGEEG